MLRFPVVQAYLVDCGASFAVVDCGPLGSDVAILEALAEVSGGVGHLQQIVLTHCHKDHAGSAAALAAKTGALVLAGAADAAVIAGNKAEPPAVITSEEQPFFDKIADLLPPAPPVPVDRLLHDGDELGWDTPTIVLHVPGHTPGSIAIHLPGERLVFTGDNIASIGRRAILGPFNVARTEAIASLRKLADLDADIACFGHGDPILAKASASIRSSAAHL